MKGRGGKGRKEKKRKERRGRKEERRRERRVIVRGLEKRELEDKEGRGTRDGKEKRTKKKYTTVGVKEKNNRMLTHPHDCFFLLEGHPISLFGYIQSSWIRTKRPPICN